MRCGTIKGCGRRLPLCPSACPTRGRLLLCSPEDPLLHDRLIHAPREPSFGCSLPAFAQGPQKRPIKIGHARFTQRRTLSLERQGTYPGKLALEERITSIIRWNALAMVMRANAAYGDLGG